MNKRIFSLFLISLLLIGFIEFSVEKKIITKKAYNDFKLKNLFVNYSFQKMIGNNSSNKQVLTRAFFQLYSDLYFLIVKKGDSVIFTANKNFEYDVLLAGYISMLREDRPGRPGRPVKDTYKSGRSHFYFNASKFGDYDIITSFKYNFSFWKPGLRNFFIIFIMMALYYYKNRDRRVIPAEKPGMREYPEEITPVREKISEEPISCDNETYKNLYEDNQRLIEQLENLSTFREVGLAINSILNFQQMLHVIMGVVINKMGVQKIVIYFINDENKELSAKIGREENNVLLEEELNDEKIIMGEGNIGRAMEYHASLILSESSDSHLLICPLIAQGTLIGAIKVTNKINGEPFHESDKALLSLLSSQIAIALNNARLYELAITDGLTKLYVHRHFQFRLQEEILRHKRAEKSLSLIMIDIDHFKSFNDNYGHQTGDFVLIAFSRMLKVLFRTTDSVFRYGGEEMAVILPETNDESAYILAEKIRKTVENNEFNFQENKLKITISLGISTFEPSQASYMAKDILIKMADESLYLSKENGRNRTTLYKNVPEEGIKEVTPQKFEEAAETDEADETDEQALEVSISRPANAEACV